MDNRICSAIAAYCKNKGYESTSGSLDSTDKQVSIEETYQKHYSLESSTGTNELKRVGCDDEEQHIKKQKLNEKDPPKDFLLLIKELKLKVEDAKLYYQTPESWKIKLKRKVFCVVKGKSRNYIRGSLCLVHFF